MNNIIEINNLNKSFGKRTLFHNFKMSVVENTMTTIYGASGCGKSTLLNMIGLIEKYDRGSIKINNEVIPKVNSIKSTLWKRNKISYIFQNFGLLPNSTINQNLNVGLKYVKKSKPELKKMKLSALNDVGLKFKLNTKIYKLLGGEQQRVAIAGAILKPSQIILADEPTGSLDEVNRNKILNLLSFLKKRGKTILIVSHDPYLKKYSDFVINID